MGIGARVGDSVISYDAIIAAAAEALMHQGMTLAEAQESLDEFGPELRRQYEEQAADGRVRRAARDRENGRAARLSSQAAAPMDTGSGSPRVSAEDYAAWRRGVEIKQWEAQEASHARMMAITARMVEPFSDINEMADDYSGPDRVRVDQVSPDSKTEAGPVAAQVANPIVDTAGKTQAHETGVRAIIPAGPMARKRWIDEKQVEEIYGFNAKTLRNWRSLGEGPPWRGFGAKSIMYQVGNLDDWIERQRQGGEGVPSSALKPSSRRTKAKP